MEEGVKTCEGPKDKSPLTIKDFFGLLSGARSERCGKLATRDTAFGPRCEECWAHLRETTRKGENILGITNGYPEKAKGES